MGGVNERALSTVCAWCDRVRSRSGEWHERERTKPALSLATHGICPDCLVQATHHATMAFELQ